MIRIEQETSANPLFSNAQFLTAARIIADAPDLHYDLTEERTKYDGITRTKLMLWTWPRSMKSYPKRTWIDESGTIMLVERCDWVTHEEWPAWALTQENEHDN